jgi:polar amino acid transport system substrate-binding protein
MRSDLYDRVTSSGVIRAAYVAYPPGSFIDPNSGELSGVFVDLLEASATALGLKVTWTEQVGWGDMIEGLASRRFDVVGTPVWANSTRARQDVDFGVPVYFSPIGVYVRADDHRFDTDLTSLNRPGVTIATIDGEMSSILAASDFPRARTLSLPQLSDVAPMLMNIAAGRADATFVEPYIANLFLATNPGTLRNIATDRPLRFFPTSIMFPAGEERFKKMINVAIQEQLNSGALDRLFQLYNVPPGTLLPPTRPYDLSR